MRQWPDCSGTQAAGAEASSQISRSGGMVLEERLRLGRIRSKRRALEGQMRSRMVSGDVEIGFPEEKLAVESHSGSGSPRGQVNMADMVLPRWQESCGGKPRKASVKKWVCRSFGRFLLILSILMLICYYLNTAFLNYVSPSDYNVRNGDNPNGKSLEKPSMWETMFNFFFPTTCIPKENQEVKPCDHGAVLKASACREGKCCYRPGAGNFTCFAPFKDNPTQRIRLFAFGVISMIGMGFLPIYCFSVCRRSTWANSLRRKITRGLKRLRKQRNRHTSDSEMLGMAMECREIFDEGKEEEESKALLSD